MSTSRCLICNRQVLVSLGFFLQLPASKAAARGDPPTRLGLGAVERHARALGRRRQTSPCPASPTWAELCYKHAGTWGSGDKCTGHEPFAKQSVIDQGPFHIGHFYEDFYPQFVDPLRCLEDLAFLEIGIASGYSLRMWREYFTGNMTLHFADVSQPTLAHQLPGTKVWIADATKETALKKIAAQTPKGAFDLIVDDGSHSPRDVRATFMLAFPMLRPGGILAIEDLNTGYLHGRAQKVLPLSGSGVNTAQANRGSHVDMIKAFIDTLNRMDFDANYTAGVDKIDHMIGSVFCTEEACAIRKKLPAFGHK